MTCKTFITLWSNTSIFLRAPSLQAHQSRYHQIAFRPFELFFPFPNTEWLQFVQPSPKGLEHADRNQSVHLYEMHKPLRVCRLWHGFLLIADGEWQIAKNTTHDCTVRDNLNNI